MREKSKDDTMRIDIEGVMLKVTPSISYTYKHEGGICKHTQQQEALRMGTHGDLVPDTVQMFAVQHLVLCRDSQAPPYSI
jgi:hypothetical protein